MRESQVQEYQQMYKAIFNKEISYEQASTEARALFELMKTLQSINSN